MASHGKSGSRPTHAAGTARSCVISRHPRPAGVGGQFGTRYSEVGSPGRSVCEIGEVGDHDHQIIDSRPSPLPDEDALARVEVDVDERGIVYRQSVRARAELDQPGYVCEYAPPPWRRHEAVEVDRVDLLLRVAQREIALVARTPRRRRSSGCPTAVSRQTKASLIRRSGSRMPLLSRKIVEPLVAEALDVVRRDVIDRLRPVSEAEQPAVDQLCGRSTRSWAPSSRSGPGSRARTMRLKSSFHSPSRRRWRRSSSGTARSSPTTRKRSSAPAPDALVPPNAHATSPAPRPCTPRRSPSS